MAVTRSATTFLDFSGRRKDGELVEATIPQFDGSPMADENCAASGETLRDIVEIARGRHPGQPWPPTPAMIRRETGDHVGGLRPTQTAAVSHRLYGIDSDIRIADSNVLIEKLWQRYGATLLVRYAPFAHAGYGGSPGFGENHTFSALGIRTIDGRNTQILISDSLRDGRRSGIPKGVVWVPWTVVQESLSDLDLGGGRTMIEAHGGHHGYFSFTTVPFKPVVTPATVQLKFGAHKVRPKRLKCKVARTNVRTSPRRISGNVARVVDVGQPFDAYQRVVNKFGAWVGNKAGDRWVMRAGYSFVGYLK